MWKVNDIGIHPLCTDEEVTAGKVEAVVMLGTLPYQKSFDLCDLLKDVNINCPVKSGKLSFGIKLKVPAVTPSVSHACHNYYA